MITVVPVAPAFYPLGKHFQIENETGQLCYANTGCRCTVHATALVVGPGQTLSFPF